MTWRRTKEEDMDTKNRPANITFVCRENVNYTFDLNVYDVQKHYDKYEAVNRETGTLEYIIFSNQIIAIEFKEAN